MFGAPSIVLIAPLMHYYPGNNPRGKDDFREITPWILYSTVIPVKRKWDGARGRHWPPPLGPSGPGLVSLLGGWGHGGGVVIYYQPVLAALDVDETITRCKTLRLPIFHVRDRIITGVDRHIAVDSY